MSAWLVSENHINTLVSFALDHKLASDGESANRLLTKENVRSLQACYPGRDFLADWEAAAKAYTFKYIKQKKLTPIVKACNCYDYQACETDDYETTPAAKFIERVRDMALALGGQTNGKLYDQLPWEID